MSLSPEVKYRLSFPIKDYLMAHFPDGQFTHNGQFVATCPRCEASGLDGKSKFYYDIAKFKGLCHRCYALTDGGGFSTIAGLIMFAEGINYVTAVQKLRAVAVVDTSNAAILSQIQKYKNTIAAESDVDDFEIAPIKIDIPLKRPAPKRIVSKMFNNRKPPMTYNITKLFPVYVSGAKFLADRIVFEIVTNKEYAWLAYAVLKGIVPKTKNPVGGILHNMLGGYNLFKKDKKPLLVVEGIFDMFRCLLRGYNVVCTFGYKLSARQVVLLNRTRASEIVLCYDNDITGVGWKAMWKMYKIWRTTFTKPLSLIFMPSMYSGHKRINTDPDSISKRKFAIGFEKRKRMT